MGLLQRLKEQRKAKRGPIAKLEDVEKEIDGAQVERRRLNSYYREGGLFFKPRVAMRQGQKEEKGLIAKLEDIEKEISDATVDVICHGGRFFSKERVAARHERIAKRRDFRVKNNRKWMLAVVVVCITIIYLSVMYF